MKRQDGFSLTELMVVLAIIAVLVTIGYPLYTEQARKSRRVEGRDALLAIAQAEERYYTVNGAYETDNIGNLGVGSAVDCSASPCVSVDKGYYKITVSGTTSTFTATAEPVASGAQASDTCTKMTIDNLGQKGGAGSGCW